STRYGGGTSSNARAPPQPRQHLGGVQPCPARQGGSGSVPGDGRFGQSGLHQRGKGFPRAADLGHARDRCRDLCG
ncbi:MAG: hypothetical protein WAU24_08830, partial [Chitinophagaceae bacterium]